MAVYTVHEPLPRKNEASADPERFAFVRDGFYFWAFLLGPLWMLWRRLWLVTLFYFVVSIGLQIGLWALGAAGIVKFVVWLLLALLVGFEAGTLRRWTLSRRGWKNIGLVVGEDVETAERRFFAAWTPPLPSMPPTPAAQPPGGFSRPGDAQIIGLFPQPGAPR
ncbi:MAG TPA: DUF2628 domain-containing protein [Xanthobacteraceae bacterium]|nr:DUF2628 domain-containing protein [Xanthobacteraceae bacterium]